MECGPLIEAFVYPECPLSEDLAGLRKRLADAFPGGFGKSEWLEVETAQGGSHDRSGLGVARQADGKATGGDSEEGADSKIPDLTGEQLATWLADETRKAEERGRDRGVETGVEMGVELGRQEAAKGLEEERARLHSQAVALLKSFTEERERYLQELEREAVQLALSIAARILRREAQMDPLLLTGAVRVALGQLAGSTAVRLHVPVQDRQLWSEALSLIPGLTLKPDVIGEEKMALGDCRMETELGSADLGLRAQLNEIERGFFDRMGSRREAGAVTASHESTTDAELSTGRETDAETLEPATGALVSQ